jgi:hypothetical protein
MQSVQLDKGKRTMKPQIDAVRFGAITVGGQRIAHDIVITPHGTVCKRKADLSKQLYGTSHRLSLAEIQSIWVPGTETLIVGAGLFGRVRLSAEAKAFLSEWGCDVKLCPLRRAVRLWNDSHGQAIGLFHITC